MPDADERGEPGEASRHVFVGAEEAPQARSSRRCHHRQVRICGHCSIRRGTRPVTRRGSHHHHHIFTTPQKDVTATASAAADVASCDQDEGARASCQTRLI